MAPKAGRKRAASDDDTESQPTRATKLVKTQAQPVSKPQTRTGTRTSRRLRSQSPSALSPLRALSPPKRGARKQRTVAQTAKDQTELEPHQLQIIREQAQAEAAENKRQKLAALSESNANKLQAIPELAEAKFINSQNDFEILEDANTGSEKELAETKAPVQDPSVEEEASKENIYYIQPRSRYVDAATQTTVTVEPSVERSKNDLERYIERLLRDKADWEFQLSQLQLENADMRIKLANFYVIEDQRAFLDEPSQSSSSMENGDSSLDISREADENSNSNELSNEDSSMQQAASASDAESSQEEERSSPELTENSNEKEYNSNKLTNKFDYEDSQTEERASGELDDNASDNDLSNEQLKSTSDDESSQADVLPSREPHENSLYHDLGNEQRATPDSDEENSQTEEQMSRELNDNSNDNDLGNEQLSQQRATLASDEENSQTEKEKSRELNDNRSNNDLSNPKLSKKRAAPDSDEEDSQAEERPSRYSKIARLFTMPSFLAGDAEHATSSENEPSSAKTTSSEKKISSGKSSEQGSYPNADGEYLMSGALNAPPSRQSNTQQPPSTPYFSSWRSFLNPVGSVRRMMSSTPSATQPKITRTEPRRAVGPWAAATMQVRRTRADGQQAITRREFTTSSVYDDETNYEARIPGSFNLVDYEEGSSSPKEAKSSPISASRPEMIDSFLPKSDSELPEPEHTQRLQPPITPPRRAPGVLRRRLEREKELALAHKKADAEEAEREAAAESTKLDKGKARAVSPDTIPNPAGCSYGIDDQYFGEEESMLSAAAKDSPKTEEPSYLEVPAGPTNDIAFAIEYGRKYGVWIGPKAVGQFAVPDSSDDESDEENPEDEEEQSPLSNTNVFARAKAYDEAQRDADSSTRASTYIHSGVTHSEDGKAAPLRSTSSVSNPGSDTDDIAGFNRAVKYTLQGGLVASNIDDDSSSSNHVSTNFHREAIHTDDERRPRLKGGSTSNMDDDSSNHMSTNFHGESIHTDDERRPRLRSGSTASNTDALARVRSQAEKYKPKTPSTLRAISAMSPANNSPDEVTKATEENTAKAQKQTSPETNLQTFTHTSGSDEESAESAGAITPGEMSDEATETIEGKDDEDDDKPLTKERYDEICAMVDAIPVEDLPTERFDHLWPRGTTPPWEAEVTPAIQAACEERWAQPDWEDYCDEVWQRALAGGERLSN